MPSEYPSRRQLIIGGALVALLQYGDSPRDVRAAREIAEAVRGGKEISTSHTGILDRLAWARQTMDVSLAEWRAAVVVIDARVAA